MLIDFVNFMFIIAIIVAIAIGRYCLSPPDSGYLSTGCGCHDCGFVHGEMWASTAFHPYVPTAACQRCPHRLLTNRLKHSSLSCNSTRQVNRPYISAFNVHHENPDCYHLCYGCYAVAAEGSHHVACLSRPILLQSMVSSK